jgi:DNA-binding response OmpR family regulator
MPKLLVVDDELDVREFARNFFRRRKLDVFIAGSGEEALSFVEKESPDLMLLDVRLGSMDGIEVLRRMRNSGHNTPVIMVTGVNEKEVMEEAKALGALDYIHKPLILDELEKVVLARLFQDVHNKEG